MEKRIAVIGFFLALLALSLSVWPRHSCAENYFAVQAGQSWQTVDHPGSVLTSYELDDSSGVGRLALGYRAGWWGLEVGYTPLFSQRTAHATVAPDIDMRQDMRSSALDLRAHLGLNLGPDFQARLIAGVAWVHFENHEYGFNPVAAEWRNDGYQLRPLYGVGLRYGITDAIGLTLDVTQVRDVVQSHWTLSSDVTSVLAGLTVGF